MYRCAYNFNFATEPFDVYYGNTTFINNHINGFKVPIDTVNIDENNLVTELANKILLFFTQNKEKVRAGSYQIAEKYLIENIKEDWKKLINEVLND